jgi:hypothetical protein
MKPAPPVMSTGSNEIASFATSGSRGELGSRLSHAIFRRLSSEPGCQLGQSLLEGNLRVVAQHPPSARDVGKAVANVADAILPRDLRL